MKTPNGFIEQDGKYLLNLENYYLKPEHANTKKHYHNELEISLVKSGMGEYTVDGKKYEIRKDDIFIFNNIEPHYISRIEPGDELVNMVIMFDPRFIWSIESNLFDSRFLNIFFKRNEYFENRLDRDNEATGEIRRLLLEIEKEFADRQTGYQLMIKVKLLNILVSLIRCYTYVREEESNYSKRMQDLVIINHVIEYINENLSMDLQLEDLAKLAHMNYSYFSSFFKKYMGINPSEYMAKQRVRRAIEYLNSSNKTVLEIASLCGFNSSAGFNKTFKRLTGKIPSEFR